MSLARIASVCSLFAALSLASACGGGGGGGAPNVPAPGTTPPGPGSSASPAPSAGPTAGPSATPAPTSNPSASASALTIAVGDGEVNGNDTMFPGGIGSEPNDGDYSGGGHGPLTNPPQTIGPDHVPCLSSMNTGNLPPQGTGYHVHAFVGIYYNGKEVALPDGIGFANPRNDGTFNGISHWTETATMCYYEMHTHDASGLVHEESMHAPSGFQAGAKYTLGDFLAVWGVTLGSNHLGPLNGAVSVFTSGQVGRGKTGEVSSTLYSRYTGNPLQIGLYSHEVIWITVGSGNPANSALPNVVFWTEW